MGEVRLATIAYLFGVVFSVATTTSGQVVEVPAFTVGTPSIGLTIRDGDVTTAPDGKLAFLWVEMDPFGHTASSRVFVRQASLPGPSLGAITRVDSNGWAEDSISPSIDAFGSGGYLAAWNTFQFAGIGYDFALNAAYLDGDAATIGSEFNVYRNSAFDVRPAKGQVVAGIPSGAVIVWFEGDRVLAQRYGNLRQPLGRPIVVAEARSNASFNLSVVTTPDAGFVIMWSDSVALQTMARRFAADGQPIGAAFSVGATARIQAIAASPFGELAVVGVPNQLAVRRFAASGVLLDEDLVTVSSSTSVRADLAFDGAGNLMVAWSDRVLQPQGISPPIGFYRVYGANGFPLGGTIEIEAGAIVSRPRVAPLSVGRFAIAWSSESAYRASVVSLCAASAPTCGDGITQPECESCDDGAANSDVLPDACRTDCRRSFCGDGVVDAGEECDDGNTVNGDCCSWNCRIEPDFDNDGVCDDDCRIFEPDFDQDGICDSTDVCPLFPDPDQTRPEICAPAPFDGLSELQRRLFAEGLKRFARIDTPESGLGPVFNGTSCAECHHAPAIGGSSTRSVIRIGRDGADGSFDPMTEVGGSVVQEKGITTSICSVEGEAVPADATYVVSRDSPALFGLGLLEAIPDSAILRFADPTDRNRDGISGRPNMIGGRVGRFGWKAQTVDLAEFAAIAYRDEMGITSPALPDETAPQGEPSTCDPVADPEDDGSDVNAFATFVRLLAPLTVTAPTKGLPLELRKELRVGRRAFRRVHCQKCHSDRLRTEFSEVKLRGRRVPVFSDLLLHDMGPDLADGIGQGAATGSEFRTAPLWGVRASAPYLHDGRAATLDDAIRAHGGEAAGSRARYMALKPELRDALLSYLNSL